MTTLPWPLARGTACRALLFAIVLAGSAGSVQAQWAWRDASGEITYSDSPPPAEVSRSDILRTPTSIGSTATGNSDSPPGAPSAPSGASGAGASAVANPTPSTAPPPVQPASKPDAAPKTLADQDADFRKRLAEQQKAEEKQSQDEAQATQRAEACNQAKTYMDMLQGGTRLLRPDANGERNFLDDDQRAAEIQKTQQTIDSNC